jgi:DNA-binding NarL/FixJ family response regulator
MASHRFLIVDDHPLFLEALGAALANGFPKAETEVAESIAAALARLAAAKFDLILLDLRMPDASGFDGLLRIKAQAPRTPVAIVSALADPELIRKIADSGASGFIGKNERRDAIVAAARALLDGKPHFPESPADPARGAGDGILARLRELTPQQMKVLSLICEGKLNKQIAYELDVAETTVKAHITSIFKKLSIHSRTQAVLVMQRCKAEGLIFDEGFGAAGHAA